MVPCRRLRKVPLGKEGTPCVLLQRKAIGVIGQEHFLVCPGSALIGIMGLCLVVDVLSFGTIFLLVLVSVCDLSGFLELRVHFNRAILRF